MDFFKPDLEQVLGMTGFVLSLAVLFGIIVS